MWLAAKISSATASCPWVMMSRNQRRAVALFCSVDMRYSPSLREWGTRRNKSHERLWVKRWKNRSGLLAYRRSSLAQVTGHNDIEKRFADLDVLLRRQSCSPFVGRGQC